jgi:hypothetical protein
MNWLPDGIALHYGWWLAALVLIAAEIVAPGYFLLWVGLAAALMWLLTLLFPDLAPPVWPTGSSSVRPPNSATTSRCSTARASACSAGT